jgi:hypothetical protein
MPNLDLKHLGLAAATVVLVAACGAAPATSPSASPTSQPSATSATEPSPAAPGAEVLHVPLANSTGNELFVDVTDASGLVQDAESGTPGDGASVEPYTVLVTNDDATTLRLTWTGGPCDAVDSLSIDDTGRNLLLVEPECPGDAVAFDRILVLHLSSPVDAEEVRAVLQDGLDTAG